MKIVTIMIRKLDNRLHYKKQHIQKLDKNIELQLNLNVVQHEL